MIFPACSKRRSQCGRDIGMNHRQLCSASFFFFFFLRQITYCSWRWRRGFANRILCCRHSNDFHGDAVVTDRRWKCRDKFRHIRSGGLEFLVGEKGFCEWPNHHGKRRLDGLCRRRLLRLEQSDYYCVKCNSGGWRCAATGGGLLSADRHCPAKQRGSTGRCRGKQRKQFCHGDGGGNVQCPGDRLSGWRKRLCGIRFESHHAASFARRPVFGKCFVRLDI